MSFVNFVENVILDFSSIETPTMSRWFLSRERSEMKSFLGYSASQLQMTRAHHLSTRWRVNLSCFKSVNNVNRRSWKKLTRFLKNKLLSVCVCVFCPFIHPLFFFSFFFNNIGSLTCVLFTGDDFHLSHARNCDRARDDSRIGYSREYPGIPKDSILYLSFRPRFM